MAIINVTYRIDMKRFYKTVITERSSFDVQCIGIIEPGSHIQFTYKDSNEYVAEITGVAWSKDLTRCTVVCKAIATLEQFSTGVHAPESINEVYKKLGIKGPNNG